MSDTDRDKALRLIEAVGVFTTLIIASRVIPEEEMPKAVLDCAYLLQVIDLMLTGDTHERDITKDLTWVYQALNKRVKIPLSSSSSYLIVDLNKEKTIDFIGSVKDVWEKTKEL
jgi:hypothetical protein